MLVADLLLIAFAYINLKRHVVYERDCLQKPTFCRFQIIKRTHLPKDLVRLSTTPKICFHNLWSQSQLAALCLLNLNHTACKLPTWFKRDVLFSGKATERDRGGEHKRCLSRHSERPWQGVSGTAILHLSFGSGLCHVCIMYITCQRQKDIQGKQHETCLPL